MLTYREISLKLLFVYKLSYKRYKPVKYRVIGSLFTRQQLIKDRGMQICTPPIWTGLNEFDNSYARSWLSSFFCNYYCSKWYNKHRICNWSVKKKARIGYFLSKVIFPSLYPFSGNFSETFWKELVCLFCKSLLSFLTFMNC